MDDPSPPLHTALGLSTDEPALVATVGGGGKTTVLFALARERAGAPQPAAPAPPPATETADAMPRISVLTTTTKFTIPSFAASWPLALGTSAASRSAAIEHAWTKEQSTIIVGAGRTAGERIVGVSSDWPAHAIQSDIVGFVGVEADGSAGRPFKAPASHEPVIPQDATHVLAIVGVQALAKPLDAQTVHRPERVATLAGVALGEPITPAVIAAVLGHVQGGRKDVGDAAFRVVVSSAERDPQGAAAIAAACHAAGIDWVIAYDAQAGLAQRF